MLVKECHRFFHGIPYLDFSAESYITLCDSVYHNKVLFDKLCMSFMCLKLDLKNFIKLSRKPFLYFLLVVSFDHYAYVRSGFEKGKQRELFRILLNTVLAG